MNPIVDAATAVKPRLCALFASVALSTLLAACSGSGGGGGGPPPPPPPPPPLPTHKVGGTVSGLVASGLVLTDNAADALALSSDGAFSFDTPVREGDAYAVVIKAQPTTPAQTCAVSAAAGTMSTTDVTDIRIDCSVNVHRIGGTVAGLSGSGLTLRESDGDTVTPTASGAFTFATAKPSGSPYQVSVATQPGSPSQTCSVSGTSSHGTVADADVTDVAVVCATEAYAVYAQVSGLLGSGLVLQDNGADNLAVAFNGGYGFATRVASGAGYNVTVKSQPANPTQTCSVASGTGLVGAGNVTTVMLSCASQAFQVRGSVTGLAGSGLVLQDNGADDLRIAAAGTFAFPTGVVSGAPYTVTVRTQPSSPAQTCTVGAGSTGTIGSADASGVDVVCSTNSYAVGGRVQGLSGVGLVLQDNNGDDLAIGADGSFQFPVRVASGGTYAVSVRGVPGTPRQACAVTGGSGTVLGADVADVQVACTTSPARWAFLSKYFQDSLLGAVYPGDVTPYAIDRSTGALGSPGALVGTGKGGGALSVTPSGAFAYVPNAIASGTGTTGGSVSSYRVDPATGVLTANGPEVAAGLGTLALAIHPSGGFVYVANYTSDSVSVFAIAPLTGLLTLVQTAPVLSPHSLSIEPRGRFLYAAQTGTNSVGVYAIDPNTGRLTHASDAPTGGQPYAVTTDAAGRFVFLLNYGSNTTPGSASAYVIDAASGALRFVNGLSTGVSPNAITVHPSGRFLYVANLGEWAAGVGYIPTGSISVYAVDATTGRLTQPLAEITAGRGGGCFAVDPTGRFAWFQNLGSDPVNGAATLTQYAIDPATGALRVSAPDLPAYGCVTIW